MSGPAVGGDDFFSLIAAFHSRRQTRRDREAPLPDSRPPIKNFGGRRKASPYPPIPLAPFPHHRLAGLGLPVVPYRLMDFFPPLTVTWE